MTFAYRSEQSIGVRGDFLPLDRHKDALIEPRQLFDCGRQATTADVDTKIVNQQPVDDRPDEPLEATRTAVGLEAIISIRKHLGQHLLVRIIAIAGLRTNPRHALSDETLK